jgi:hypothetical protein
MRDFASDLKEVFALPSVHHLEAMTPKNIYNYLTSHFPPLKIEAKLPVLRWHRLWVRLHTATIPPALIDIDFATLHNILPLQIRRHRLGLAASPACLRCVAASEVVLHFFNQCPRVTDAWETLVLATPRAIGGPLPDLHLLLLGLPLHADPL